MNIEHSPLPWKVVGRRKPIIESERGVVAYSNELMIEGTDIANSLFIIKACNHHEELVQALKGMMNMAACRVEETVAKEGVDTLQSDIRRAYLLLKKLEQL